MLMTWNSHWWRLFYHWNDLISSLFILNYSWWYKIQKPRETLKVNLELQFTLISRNKLFILTQSLPFSRLSHSLSLSLFCSSRKVSGKNLPQVSCFVESKFFWQSEEIRLPYHLGSIICTKWLALKNLNTFDSFHLFRADV